MANRSLGSLTIDLIAKIGGWTNGLSQAERELDKRTKRMNKMANDFGRGIGSALKSAATGFLAFAGVAVSIGSATNAIKGAIDRADQLRDASIRLGVGVETLSAFGYAAQQTGTDIEELNKGLLRLSRNATTALDPKSRQAGLFQALGVSKDALTDLNKLVPQVADAFSQMEDGATKAALAQELFGRSGANLIEFLNQGGSGLTEMTDRARELGIVIDQETADAADEFNDKLADLKAAGTGLATQVASELLPQLTNLVNWATEFVSDGDNAREIADDVAEAMRGLAEAIRLVVGLGTGLSTIREQLAGAENAWRGFIGNFGLNGTFSKALKDAMPWAYKEFGGGSQAAPTPSVTRLPAVTVTGTRQQSDLEKRLAGFFATGGRTSGGAKKTGKSDAEREAEQLKAAYDRLAESLREQIALGQDATEVDKVRYELANSELAKLNQSQKDGLVSLAATLDLKQKEAEFEKERAQIDEEAAKADRLRLENAQELLEDMQFELSILGMTNKERERAIALKYAEVDATGALGQEIAAMSDRLYEAAKAQEVWGEFERSMSDAIVDLTKDFGNAKNIVKDFFDSVAEAITRSIAEGWAEKLTQWFKASASSSASSGIGGFNWGALVGALFGGGKASGGWAMPNTIYEVNERGFEMATVGGRDYMLTGPQPAYVTPNHQLGGGVNQTLNFQLAAPTDPRTQQQIASRVGFESRRAMTRNGG